MVEGVDNDELVSSDFKLGQLVSGYVLGLIMGLVVFGFL